MDETTNQSAYDALILQVVEFSYMLVIDMIFLVILILLMLPLGIWRQAAFAVMKRNFIGYFSNPTGYVFLCLFVLLTSFAAFWPHEFFTTNLANFDQLNAYLPYIMLIFIPAITMSIWAEERRQGTDELLLTLPAKDFDIVIGKYFAAVLVFTVSLLFSQLSNYGVLLSMTGGQLDNLLLFSTYLGYWFMGIAMIALGMVASFLTRNLTVGFIFGAALNAPLAFFSNADVILSDSTWISRLFDWSLLQRFEPFGRGLISLPSIFYFIGIVVIGVYLSLILIGRRHWAGGRDGTSMFWHYLVRAAMVMVIVVAGVLIVQHSPLNQARVDISDKQINTLSPETVTMLEDLASEPTEDAQPINIEAYIGDNIPSEFVRLKYDLTNLLREFDVRGGKRVNLTLHENIRPFSQDAILAEKKYGIRPVKVRSESRGAVKEDEVILGMAFTSGLQRLVVPFMAYGTPVEYELMRSINTVSQSDKKTVGVVITDALPLGGQIQQQGRRVNIPPMQILSELGKQYNLARVNAGQPIDLFKEDDDGNPVRRYDSLLVIQPSQSTPAEMKNIVAAIQMGQPTAIFEDPMPNPMNFRHVAPTFSNRLFQRNGGEQADMKTLTDALDIELDFSKVGDNVSPYVLWHSESQNPYKQDRSLSQKEQLIIKETNAKVDPRFSQESIATQGILELYFQFSGYLSPKAAANPELEFEPLVNSGDAGRILSQVLMRAPSAEAIERERGAQNSQYVIAAHIKGQNADAPITPDTQPAKANTNVIYVSDIDTLSDFFMRRRAEPVDNGIEYFFQNVSFFLNIVDSLAGVSDFAELRTKKINHVTLEVVEKTYKKAMAKVYKAEQELLIEFQNEKNKAEAEAQQSIDPIRNKIRPLAQLKQDKKPYDATRLMALQSRLEQEAREQEARIKGRVEELENDRNEQKREIELVAELEIQEIQRKYKIAAVLIPPIPPLLVGIFVATRRRLREREGISKARRLK
jgi:ABC-2 type transport system permease protein